MFGGVFFPRSEFVKLKYINSFLLARLEDIVLSIGFYIYYGAFRPNQIKFSPCVAHGSLFAGVNGWRATADEGVCLWLFVKVKDPSLVGQVPQRLGETPF